MSDYTAEQVFEMLRAAYERGYNWGQENPDSRPFLNKAAYDYADKTIGDRADTVSNTIESTTER